MRFFRLTPLFMLLLSGLFSCNKDLNVNADWKDVTVVYGLLDQTQDTTFIKITKAFLGEGDALRFAKVPDSSTYPGTLDVWLYGYADSTLMDSFHCDTVTVHNKEAGDSIFYFPNQLMYYTLGKLNPNYTYKLYIKNKKTGKVITSQTRLVRDFNVERPMVTASFSPGQSFNVRWTTTKNGNGERYQLVIRFFYLESLKSSPSVKQMKSIDWLLFNNIKPTNPDISQKFDLYFPANSFYSLVGAKIPVDSLVDRVAHHCEFIFTVGTPELSTYMDVTEPSLSLVQEKPSYTNIVNGIGLFSARFMKSVDSLGISQLTIDSLKINAHTKNLGF